MHDHEQKQADNCMERMEDEKDQLLEEAIKALEEKRRDRKAKIYESVLKLEKILEEDIEEIETVLNDIVYDTYLPEMAQLREILWLNEHYGVCDDLENFFLKKIREEITKIADVLKNLIKAMEEEKKDE